MLLLPWSTPYSKPTQPGVSRQCSRTSMLALVTQAWGMWVAGCWMYSMLPSSLPLYE